MPVTEPLLRIIWTNGERRLERFNMSLPDSISQQRSAISPFLKTFAWLFKVIDVGCRWRITSSSWSVLKPEKSLDSDKMATQSSDICESPNKCGGWAANLYSPTDSMQSRRENLHPRRPESASKRACAPHKSQGRRPPRVTLDSSSSRQVTFPERSVDLRETRFSGGSVDRPGPCPAPTGRRSCG